MFRRIACALVALSLTSVVAYGAEASDPRDDLATIGSTDVVKSMVPASVVTWHPTRESHRARPAALPAFYASLAALQLFDGYSTTRALAGGAKEANRVMKGVVTRPAVFWSVMAAVAAHNAKMLNRVR